MELKPGCKQTEVGLIPEDWEAKNLGGLVTLQRGHDLTWRDRREGNIPIMGSAGPNGSHDTALAKGPGVVLGRSGASFGQAHYCEHDFWPHNTALYVKDFKGNYPLYIYYLLCSINFSSHNSGGAQQSLNRNFIASILIAVPDKKEQYRIAKALSDSDELIRGLEELLSKKHYIKQAAMHELLNGQRRLPGFGGEWEEMAVKDVVTKNFCGPSPTCQTRNIDGNDEWGVLKTTAITWENGWTWRAHKLLPASYWGKSEIELKQGDVLVTKAGPRHRVGVSTWIDQIPGQIIPSGKMIALRPNTKRAEPLMLAAAIASRSTQIHLDQRTTGMAESQVNFENEVLLSAPITLPKINEQIAISKICNEFEKELKSLKDKIKTLRNIKVGMMQELLTGKIRLQ